jgi:hypothetical protein
MRAAAPARVQSIEFKAPGRLACDLLIELLSDNVLNPTKWQFPTGTSIAANGYLVVWAYDTTFSGALFATWALNKDGEYIRLSNANQSVMDSTTFGPQPKNRTRARIPNGTGSFSSSCLPTLGMANTCAVTGVTGGQIGRDAAGLTLARGGAGRITVGFTLQVPGRTRLAVQDVRGREVAVLLNGPMAAGTHARALDAGTLPAGSYWVVLRSGSTESVRSLVLLR